MFGAHPLWKLPEITPPLCNVEISDVMLQQFALMFCHGFPKMQRKLKDPDVLGQDVRRTSMMYAHVMYTSMMYINRRGRDM